MVKQEIDHGFLISAISVNGFTKLIFNSTGESEYHCTYLFNNIILLIIHFLILRFCRITDLGTTARLKLVIVSDKFRLNAQTLHIRANILKKKNI